MYFNVYKFFIILSVFKLSTRMFITALFINVYGVDKNKKIKRYFLRCCFEDFL